MVTDQQYRDVLKRIENLEDTINAISRELTQIKMRNGRHIRETEAYTEPESKKDVTRYLFDGQKYNKRQLVLAVVKKYIADQSIQDPEDFWDVFPDYIQGSLGVLREVGEAEVYVDSAARYYFEDENIINIADGQYVVCKDWTAKNIRKFLEIAETLGYKIQPLYRI